MSKQLNFRFSSPVQIKGIFRVLSSKEKLMFYAAILVLLASLVAWTGNYYLTSTKTAPDYGGEYTEGMVGEPMYINPLLSQTSEVDAAMSRLIFSSILKYDATGNLVGDLAESYDISEDGLLYTVRIKQSVKWHDKTDLTANDIAFTIRLIQDPAYMNLLRGEWQDVTVTVVDDHTITFGLKKPYTPFPHKLTVGILPQHIYEQLTADKFLLNDWNLKPVGSGPFVYADPFKQDDKGNIISYHLIANPDYYDGKPYLEQVNFNFYSSEDALVEAYNKKEVNGLGNLSSNKFDQFLGRKDSHIYPVKTPRYFAVFFNPTKSKPLSDKDVRQALNFATDRKAIITEVFHGYAEEVSSPILPSFGQFSSSGDYERFDFNPTKAAELLDKAGWKKQDDGLRKKDDQVLEIALITTQWPDLARTAELLKSQWEAIGVKVTITNLTTAGIKDNFIRPREYQSILFGQEYFGSDPDPYHFWHSSGKKDPGRNIAVYENSAIDKLLEESREIGNMDERKAKYAEFEKTLINDAPAVFLYAPSYVYLANKKVKGIELTSVINPAYRFSDAHHWYIKTKRVKK